MKKLLLLFTISLLISLNVCSQETDDTLRKLSRIVKKYNLGLGQDFEPGFLSIYDGENYGAVNTEGDIIIPCKEDWHFYEGGFGADGNGGYMIKRNEKWAYLDKNGKQITSFIYSFAGDFHDGLASVKLIGEEGTSFIDTNYKIVFSLSNHTWNDFSEGLLAYRNSEDLYGFLNTRGYVEIPHVFKEVGAFHDGLAKIRHESQFKYGFINKSGEVVVPCIYEMVNNFSDGLACVKKNGKYGYIDKTGKMVIPCNYSFAENFLDGLAIVTSNGKSSCVNKLGKVVIPAIYKRMSNLGNGLVRVDNDSYKPSIIDKTGKTIVPFGKYEDMGWPFSEGLLWVKTKDSKYGYIDTRGNLVIPCNYTGACNFHKGLASVSMNGVCGFITKSGKGTFDYLNEDNTNEAEDTQERNENAIYDKVEQMPSFNGGIDGIVEYLSNNLKYPSDAEEKGIEGRVILTFVVDIDGSITDIKVVNSVYPSLDNEAVRLIKNMPKWNPGIQDGRPVRVKYTIPLPFRLQ